MLFIFGKYRTELISKSKCNKKEQNVEAHAPQCFAVLLTTAIKI